MQAEREDKAQQAANELLLKESEISAIKILLSEHGKATAAQNGLQYTTPENKAQYQQIMIFIAQMRSLMNDDDEGAGAALMATTSAHKVEEPLRTMESVIQRPQFYP